MICFCQTTCLSHVGAAIPQSCLLPASLLSVNTPCLIFPCSPFVSSCSPDFGAEGVADRLGQVSPKLVFFSLDYEYGGKRFDCRSLAAAVLSRLPGEVAYGN